MTRVTRSKQSTIRGGRGSNMQDLKLFLQSSIKPAQQYLMPALVMLENNQLKCHKNKKNK